MASGVAGCACVTSETRGRRARAGRPRAPRKLRKRPGEDALRAVVDECIVLADRLVWLAEHIHGEEGRGAVRRGVLRGLVRFGPQTVPSMARARSVSRQSLQPVVDALVREGLVRRAPNPRHRRSPLYEATPAAAALVARLDASDGRVLGAVRKGLSPDALRLTAETLARVRAHFELRWRVAAGRP